MEVRDYRGRRRIEGVRPIVARLNEGLAPELAGDDVEYADYRQGRIRRRAPRLRLVSRKGR